MLKGGGQRDAKTILKLTFSMSIWYLGQTIIQDLAFSWTTKVHDLQLPEQ